MGEQTDGRAPRRNVFLGMPRVERYGEVGSAVGGEGGEGMVGCFVHAHAALPARRGACGAGIEADFPVVGAGVGV